jgi:predicted acetyltransferase
MTVNDASSPRLIDPCAEFESSYRSYICELGDEERYPFPLDFDYTDFPHLLQRLRNLRAGIGVPEGYAPSATFWLIEGAQIVGVSNLRLHLTPLLRELGGHIGLSIRPSRRGRGLGKLLLQLTLTEARQHGIAQVHVHCHKHNTASARMIIANGGVLHSEVSHDDACVQRFLIEQVSP